MRRRRGWRRRRSSATLSCAVPRPETTRRPSAFVRLLEREAFGLLSLAAAAPASTAASRSFMLGQPFVVVSSWLSVQGSAGLREFWPALEPRDAAAALAATPLEFVLASVLPDASPRNRRIVQIACNFDVKRWLGCSQHRCLSARCRLHRKQRCPIIRHAARHRSRHRGAVGAPRRRSGARIDVFSRRRAAAVSATGAVRLGSRRGGGPALSEDAAYECWLAFGGSPRPATKKKEDKGFFGNFVAQIAENAGGVKDTRKRTSGATRSRA